MDDIRDLMAPYVLDALDEDERRRFEAHLADHPELAEELATMQAGVDAIADTIATEPPPTLRASVLGAVADTPQEQGVIVGVRSTPAWRRWIAALAVAATAVVAVIVGVTVGDEEVTAADVIAAGDARTVTASVADQEARLDYSLELGAAVVTFDDLPAVSTDRTYELWVIDETGATPAGLFRPGVGTTQVLLDEPVAAGVTIGLTVEPAGGSPQPTGEILATWSVST